MKNRDKIRKSFDITKEEQDLLDKLVESKNFRTDSEILRKSLRMIGRLSELIGQGYTIQATKGADEKIIELIFL